MSWEQLKADIDKVTLSTPYGQWSARNPDDPRAPGRMQQGQGHAFEEVKKRLGLPREMDFQHWLIELRKRPDYERPPWIAAEDDVSQWELAKRAAVA